MAGNILSIDQGTTSSRALVFGADFRIKGIGQQAFAQHYPQAGWVEHAAEDLWQTTLASCRTALAKSSTASTDIAGIGITNQRETTLIWDRASGKVIHNAIVWQDRRTADVCRRLKGEGHEAMLAERTGLLLDPYFSATKIGWLLDSIAGARVAAEHGRLAFGTVDSFLIWRLTGGRVHATDATNAARTLLFNINTGDWDADLLRLFTIPRSILPEVKDCAAHFGETDKAIFGATIPILGVAGDQQAAGLGQACFEPGMMKATYGTGCFALLNTGSARVASSNRMLTTIAYQLSGKRTYALEGSIFIAGAAVQWLRDGLGIIERASQSAELASAADTTQDVYLVPAFVGLGAPHWSPEARGAIFGLTRNSGPKELARAALESVCYQTSDLIEAMRGDWQAAGAQTVLRVDGGMVASDWMLQRLADILDAPVDRPQVLETTALGAAWLAGQAAGVWPGMEGFAKAWALERQFRPEMAESERARKVAGWRRAVAAVLAMAG